MFKNLLKVLGVSIAVVFTGVAVRYWIVPKCKKCGGKKWLISQDSDNVLKCKGCGNLFDPKREWKAS